MSAPKKTSSRRGIPAVEKVLVALGSLPLPRPALVEVVRRELARVRKLEAVPEFEEVVEGVKERVARLWLARLQPVINGTGVLLHTNLGRAPLGRSTVQDIVRIGSGYNNLEFDLATGGRGGRASYLEHNLAVLCRSESATVVNNCAAALVLALRIFTRRKKEVVISRGELIQIGGGFKIPEILEASGAKLREIGTTNRTALKDYQRAFGPETGLVLSVHRSNFFMDGFVGSPRLKELAALARTKRIPLLLDLGSGAVRSSRFWAGDGKEPTPAEMLRQGADLVCFSGDKLLGGPQSGILAGASRWISRLKSDPFFRAVRCDKLILAALQSTIDLYLSEQDREGVPLFTMLETPLECLRDRAERIAVLLRGLPVTVSIGASQAQFGGGTLPKAALPSVTLDLRPLEMGLNDLAACLRRGAPPVVGYSSGGLLRLDLRTVFPEQDEELAAAVRAALAAKKRSSPGLTGALPPPADRPEHGGGDEQDEDQFH